MVSTGVFSQSTTNSPYSKYGIGLLRSEAYGANFAMGGTGIGMRSNKDIGFLNPASYSEIGVTTFEVGFMNNALWLEDNNETQYKNNQYIDHIAFGVPILKNKWGVSFGVLPYSNTGFNYDEVIDDPIAGNISFYNVGEGAINKFYLGNGFSVKLDSTSNLSAGVNAYFLFGSMKYDQKAIYGDLNGGFNIWKIRDISVADFGADIGMQYHKLITNAKDEKIKLTLGLTYGLAANIGGTRSELIRTFTGNIDFGTIKDTVESIEDVDNSIELPSDIGVGFSIEKDKKWLIAVDYTSANWGSIASNDPSFTYQSNYGIAVGGQIIPRYDGSNYFQRIAYRLGARYKTSYIAINNTDWSEYGITFGIGLPIRRAESSYPRLNLGMEYGSRGTLDNGLIKENFLNFNVGITINAVWFQKRKYD